MLQISSQLQFRKATVNDLDKAYQVYVDAIAEMNRNSIPQWDEHYPDRDILNEDISKGELFIGAIDDDIACAYVVNAECDEQYGNGSWAFPQATFRVIHRVCVSPRFQNKGIGSLVIQHIEEELKTEGIESIRLDAFTQNPYALKMYEKLGYTKVGYADWRKGRFYLMEKKL